jgi:hypothetical protein
VVAAIAYWVSVSGGSSEAAPVVPGENDTSMVEVLNGTRVDGLARAATLRLRQAGIDVVYFGTAAQASVDTTLIMIRRGDSTAAIRVQDVIGAGRIVMDPDPSLLLDVSVLLGHDVARADRITP